MKMCIYYLLRRCEFVITLKFALIIPLSCKAKLYFCSMENGHANINFMLYLCHLFVTCVIIVFSIWRLASVLCPWPQALASSLLVPAAGPSRWPLASNLEPSLSQLLGARDQATTQETLWTQSQGFNWELFRTHPNIHHFFINYRMISLEAYRACVGRWQFCGLPSPIKRRKKGCDQNPHLDVERLVKEKIKTGILLFHGLVLFPALLTNFTKSMITSREDKSHSLLDTRLDLHIIFVLLAVVLSIIFVNGQAKNEKTRVRSDCSFDMNAQTSVPSLRGGARTSNDDMCAKAIRSAWRHGINLKRGRQNPGIGNCSIEVSIFNYINVHRSFSMSTFIYHYQRQS